MPQLNVVSRLWWHRRHGHGGIKTHRLRCCKTFPGEFNTAKFIQNPSEEFRESMMAFSGPPPPPRRRPGVVIRPLCGVETDLAAQLRAERWASLEWSSAPPTLSRAIIVDGELVGVTGLTSIRLDTSKRPVDQLPVVSIAEAMHAGDPGRWVVKTGLFVDLRIRERTAQRTLGRIRRRAGPLLAELYARRSGMRGWIASVILRGFNSTSPVLSKAAYLQQVAAGAIDEPHLAEYLRAGARPVGVVDGDESPRAVVVRRLS